jgi:hypothetical protein
VHKQGGGTDPTHDHAKAARKGGVARRDGDFADDLFIDERRGEGEDGQGDEELKVVFQV